MSVAVVVYLGIFLVGFLILLSSFLFGADHDVDHDVDVGHLDHDTGGGHDHSVSPGIFSTKVICCFLVGFGAAALLSNAVVTDGWTGFSKYAADLGMGFGGGFVVGLGGWSIIKLFLSQQAHYEVNQSDFVGIEAPLSIGIPENGVGEMIFALKGRRQSMDVRSLRGTAIPTGTVVKVVRREGSIGFVEKIG